MQALLIVIILVLIAASTPGCGERQTVAQRPAGNESRQVQAELPPPGEPVVGRKPPMPQPIALPALTSFKVEVVASGLVTPWDIAFVSRNRAYVTERPGRVRLIENGKLRARPYASVDAAETGEGGLMGIALHPKYPNPRYVYVMYTYRSGANCAIALAGSPIPGQGLRARSGVYGRLRVVVVGPDGALYVSTSNRSRGQPSSSDDRILRVSPK